MSYDSLFGFPYPLAFADLEANNNYFHLFPLRSNKIGFSLPLFAFASFLLFHGYNTAELA